MAVPRRMALLALMTVLIPASACARDGGRYPRGPSTGSEIGFVGAQGDLAGPDSGRLSGTISLAFGRMAALVEESRQEIRATLEAFSRAFSRTFHVGLGATASLGGGKTPAERDSVSVGRLGFLAAGVISVAGCITFAARRYWYNRFWQPECLEVWQRLRQLEEASSSAEEGDAVLDLQARRAFWDAVPEPEAPKVALPDLEYVRMLIKLGYHGDALGALREIEGRAVAA